ncbi:MAG: V-type ATP synthase subunit D, partial [Candidatus Scalindua sediminis]
MKLHIKATRMELLQLRKRLAIATRGHKLLNDKLEGLMREFLSMLKEYKGRRILVDRELPGIVKLFILAYVTSSKSRVIIALEQSKTAYKFTLKQRRI